MCSGRLGKDQFHLVAERVGEILPAAAGVAENRSAVHDEAGELRAKLVGQRELVVPGEEQHRQLARIEGEMGEIDLDRAIVDPQFAGGPGEQSLHVGGIGHPVAVLNPFSVLGHPACVAQRGFADQGGRTRRALLLAAAQRRGGQRQRRKRFAARLMLRLGLRRRTAIDRPGVAFVGPAERRQPQAAFDAAADGRRQPETFEKLPPRNVAATLPIRLGHGFLLPRFGPQRAASVALVRSREGANQQLEHDSLYSVASDDATTIARGKQSDNRRGKAVQ